MLLKFILSLDKMFPPCFCWNTGAKSFRIEKHSLGLVISCGIIFWFVRKLFVIILLSFLLMLGHVALWYLACNDYRGCIEGVNLSMFECNVYCTFWCGVCAYSVHQCGNDFLNKLVPILPACFIVMCKISLKDSDKFGRQLRFCQSRNCTGCRPFHD